MLLVKFPFWQLASFLSHPLYFHAHANSRRSIEIYCPSYCISHLSTCELYRYKLQNICSMRLDVSMLSHEILQWTRRIISIVISSVKRWIHFVSTQYHVELSHSWVGRSGQSDGVEFRERQFLQDCCSVKSYFALVFCPTG